MKKFIASNLPVICYGIGVAVGINLGYQIGAGHIKVTFTKKSHA